MTTTEHQTMTVRALADKRNGEVCRRSKYLLLNANVINEKGEIKGIVTLDFQGSEIPTPEELKFSLIVSGSPNHYPKFGDQFAVHSFAVIDEEEEQKDGNKVIRYPEARRLSPAEMRAMASAKKDDRLTGKLKLKKADE